MKELDDLKHLAVMGNVLTDAYIGQTCCNAYAVIEALKVRVKELECIITGCQTTGEKE